MTILIQPISPVFFLDAHHELVYEHWKEVESGMGFTPDTERYKQLEIAGSMLALGLWVDDVAVGYVTAILGTHAHDKDTYCAMVDMIYVKPGNRGYASAKLFLAIEEEAAKKGVDYIVWYASPSSRLYLTLHEHGYEELEIVMRKRIKR